MLKDVFEKIKQQEEMAGQLVQRAKAEARDILKSVESAVAEDERSAVQDNRAMLQAHLDNARKDFASQLDNLMSGKRSEESERIQRCSKNKDAAADFIVERVMRHGTH